MDEEHRPMAGLQTCLIRSAATSQVVVVFLHGYGMRTRDLTTFAHSLGVAGVSYAFPQAPTAAGDGYTWWPIDAQERDIQRNRHARDLAYLDPPGRSHARTQIRELLEALQTEFAGQSLVLAGFSQGGMLACDVVLHEPIEIDGLAMMSASCIALGQWRIRAHRLRGLPAFVSHGRNDPDLAFSAGERLERLLASSGAAVTWVPFDGGHEIPFTVWRHFRSFTRSAVDAATFNPTKNLSYGTH